MWQVYNRLQEAVRKDAERLYDVPWSRWFITTYPARYMSLPRFINTAKAVDILHNMAIELSRHGFIWKTRRDAAAAVRGAGSGGSRSGDRPGEAFTKDDGPRYDEVWGGPLTSSTDDQVRDERGDQGPPLGTGRYMRMAEKEAKDVNGHLSFLGDLAEHVWADRGRLLAPYVRLPHSSSAALF